MKLAVVFLLLSLSHNRPAVAAAPTVEASVRDAYHLVERECSAEVERLCHHHDDLNVVSARSSAMVDPPPPPLLAPRRDMEQQQQQQQQQQQEQEPSLLEMDELTKIVDGIMESILNTLTFHHSVSFVDEQSDSFVLAPPPPPMMIMMFDSMITDLASSQPYHDLPIFADRLVAHGFRILDSSEDDNDSAGVVRCHLARRLTEVNADTLHHRIHMPFGQCLMNAFERGDISKECHDSMARLANLELEQEEKANRLADILVCVYCGIMIMVLFYRCKNKPNKMVRSCRFRVRLFVLLILACVAIVNPFLLFPVLWAIVLCKIIYRYYAKGEDDDTTCGCCCCSCCGATPEAAKNGTLTEDQLDCCCCNGTGDCSCCCCSASPKELACCCCCCSCCGATPEAAKNGTLTEDQLSCCCCNGTGECSCCCCCCCSKKSSPKGRGQKHVLNSSTAVYEGVPIQIV